MEWYRKTIADTLAELGSSPGGLTAEEAAQRLALHGPNELVEKLGRTPLAMLLAQFTDFSILVLLGAAILSAAVGDIHDALAILAIVVLNAVIGFIQEFRAEKAIAALKRMATPSTTVLRDGTPVQIPAGTIVPGDVVLLEAGNVVPADLRLVEAVRLQAEESALTGESVPVEKTVSPLAGDRLPLGDRTNLTYKGTVVVTGRGRGVAVATGMGTELGKIAAMLQATGDMKTPLQKRLAGFGRRLALVIILLCAVVFLLGFLRGEPPLLMFLTAVSLAVAAIPEALPAVVTISLALGARKMVRQNALIRRLPAVETLGSVTHICSDKTGTLTLNRMTVEQVWLEGRLVSPVDLPAPAGSPAVTPGDWLLAASALCNDVHYDGTAAGVGDPTEVALYAMAAAGGYGKKELVHRFPRLAELPFDAGRMCMTTFHRGEEGVVSFTKGAAEVLLARSTHVLTSSGPSPLDRDGLSRASEQMADQGLRVLALAMRRWERVPDLLESDVEAGLTLIGLVGMLDPPREEAVAAVALCRGAGITPVMITGDHPVTARVIARRVGILTDGGELVLTGRELEDLSLEEFEREVERVRVYARVAPEQKLKIVQALQERGYYVAMTGDGVNDAPALQRADIGVAMGITGTDVAKEAAAMILLDDNFATIVKAVREGRRIYANILKFIVYSITSNTGTLVAICCAPLIGLPLPLLPIQILWLNLLCDSLPGLALTAEPAEPDVMERPPVKPDEGIFDSGRGWFIAGFGILIGIVALILQQYAMAAGMAWQTMVFTFLVANRMAVAFTVRSGRQSLFRIGIFSNRLLVVAVLFTLALQLAAVYLPLAHSLFSTASLAPAELAVTLILAAGMLAVGEGEKWLLRLLMR
ncbi:cation-translocating P-type ATPase [Geomobilimonas luticola]|uniref:Cation-translocating P-type ATPase n=1 Tax=Geomobilimonas luticola TaxID=1114878 RepID=A0ABS5SBW7_9BACT|nr:cation-translocating P-type ATPase [Geomobilimonas luticola]MBT0652868.1 cation-translocating P-type ATPase [Geomobilimonas luticola]